MRTIMLVSLSVRWTPRIPGTNDGPVDLDELEGRVCYVGFKLAFTTDVTTFVLVFPLYGDDDKYAAAPRFWIPEDNLKLRVTHNHVPYGLWNSQGFLETSEGNLVPPPTILTRRTRMRRK